ncbi:MAG: hybrid sensor histidine kinase/response regulator [Pseudomonadota bacterium]
MQEPDDNRLRSLELATVMRTGRYFTIGMLNTMLIVVVFVYSALRIDVLAAWCSVYLAFIASRAWVTRRYFADPHRESPASTRKWRRVIYITSSCSGALLGSLAWVAMPALSLPARMALTFLVVIFCVISAAHVASFLGALILLRLFALLPFAAAWFLLPSDYQSVGWVLLLTPFVGTFIARNHHKAIKENWTLVVKNEKLAAELLKRNQELQELGDSRNRLFAVAGHDLRQPVHALGLTLEQLDQRDPPQVFRRHVERMRQSSYLASEMLQDLMDISNLERKDYTVNMDTVPLDALVDQMRLSQEAVARAKGIRLVIAQEATRLAVRSDANLLRRILMNLVTNAIKYTPAGTVSVECAAEGDEVAIRVRDTGVGIPPEYLQDIFADYVRVGGAGRKDEGMGLGLSVVRRAADRLGHRLSVQSEVGVGSVFELRAGAAALPALVLPLPQAPAQDERGNVARIHGRTLLVIEDDEYARVALCGLLEQWGYVPVAGAGALEALAALVPAQVPALVISDLQLSADEDGFDAIALVRQRMHSQQLPALIITGDGHSQLVARAAALGISVARKPVPPPLLKQIILALLESPAKAA